MVLSDGSPRPYGRHRRGVELRAARIGSSPVSVDASVVIHEDGWVESHHAFGPRRIRRAPVADGERSVRTRRLRDHRVPPGALVVRVEPVCLRSVCIGRHGYVGGEKDVAESILRKRPPLGVGERPEYDAVKSPIREIVDWSGPHDLVAAAVFGQPHVVRAIEVHAPVAWLVGIVEDMRLSVGYVLPQRQERIRAEQRGGAQHCGNENSLLFHLRPALSISSSMTSATLVRGVFSRTRQLGDLRS